MRKQIGFAFICLALLFAVPTFSASEDSIKVGSLNALTGPFGVEGVAQSYAAKLAAEHINKDGGILGKKLEVLIGDDETSPSTAARVARKFILENKVNFIIGANGTPAATGVSEVAKRFKKIYLCSAGAMGEALTGKNCDRYTFRINNSGAHFYRADAAYVARTFPDIKTIAGINPDYSYGREMWSGFVSELKKLRPDIEVVGESWVPMTEKDYTNFISALIEKKPDVTYSVFWSGTVVAFVNQAKPYGLFDKTKFYLAAAAIGTASTFIKKDMVHMWGSDPYVFTLDNAMNKRFAGEYMNLHGYPPFAYCAHAYGAMMILKQAIEKAKSTDTEKVITALEDGMFDAPWGKTTIRKGDHQAMGKIFIGEVKPSPQYDFWVLSNFKSIPCEEVSLPVAETGCKME